MKMKQAIFKIAVCGTLIVVITSSLAWADVVPPDQVKFADLKVEAPLTGTGGNVENGKKWFANRKLGNCLACHQNKDMTSQPFHGEIGPSLDGVSERYSASQLRAILINSKAVFGNKTIMPGFYRINPAPLVAKKFQGKTILSGQQVEDILAYLLTLKE